MKIPFIFWQDFSQQSRMIGAGASVTMTPQASHSQGSNSAAEMNEITSLSSLLTTEASSAAAANSTSGPTVAISGNALSLATEVVYSGKREGIIGDCKANSSNKLSGNTKSNNNNSKSDHHNSGNNPSDEKLTMSAPLLPKNDKILEQNNIANK